MKKYLFIIAGAFLVFAGGYAIYNALTFRLVSSSPAGGDKPAATTASVSFTFNHPLDEATLKNFTLSPTTKGRLYLEKNSIVFTPDLLFNNVSYTATLSSAVSKSGKTSGPYSISFKTGYVDFNKMSEADQERAIDSSDSLERNFPVVAVLPDETEQFSIQYSTVENNKLNVSITLYATLNRPEQYDAYQATLKEAKQAALKFLTDNKGDLSKLNITYDPAQADKL